MKKIILYVALILFALLGYLLYENITTPIDQLDGIIDVENGHVESSFNESSKSVLKIVHTLSSGNQIVNKTASAVIITEDQNYYYAITNYHVMSKEGFETTNLAITSYLNQTFQAEIVEMNQAQEYIAVLYDLALIRFEKNLNELPLPVIREQALSSTSFLYAIGYPSGNRTTSSGYYIDLVDVSGYSFKLIEHSADIEHGFSGGALLDVSGKLVGINVSGIFNQHNEFITGYAIPVTKVLEFINLF